MNLAICNWLLFFFQKGGSNLSQLVRLYKKANQNRVKIVLHIILGTMVT